MSDVCLVIPCYNEAARLRGDPFLDALRAQPDLRLLLVNDGSSDATWPVLHQLCLANPQRLTALNLPKNVGKAEAVRQGLVRALRETPQDPSETTEFIGYWDADLSTPLEELPRFVEALRRRADVQVVMGSRVRMLGCEIDRTFHRYLAGRVFATAVSLALDAPVYDTQCGAKLIRVGPLLHAALSRPMTTRWLLDVELLMRLREVGMGPLPQTVLELPLARWRDTRDSRVHPSDFFVSLRQLADLWRRHRRARRT